jgi:hypothetical protein
MNNTNPRFNRKPTQRSISVEKVKPKPLSGVSVLVCVNKISDIDSYATLLMVWDDGKWSKAIDGLPETVSWLSNGREITVGSLWNVRIEPTVDNEESDKGNSTTQLDNSTAYRVVESDQEHTPQEISEILYLSEVISSKDTKRNSIPMKPMRSSNTSADFAESFITDKFDDLESLRTTYFSSGLCLKFIPTRCLYVGVTNQFICGPFEINNNDKSGNWRIDNDFRKISVFPFVGTDFSQSITINGMQRVLVKPNAKPLRSLMQVDFRSDSEFYAEQFRDIAEPDMQSTDLIHQLQCILGSEGLSAYEVHRIRHGLNAVLDEVSRRAIVHQLISKHPAVQLDIEAELTKLKTEYMSSLLDEHAARSEELVSLGSLIVGLKQEESNLKDSINKLEGTKLAVIQSIEMERLKFTQEAVDMKVELRLNETSGSPPCNGTTRKPNSPIILTPESLDPSGENAIRFFVRILESHGISSDAGYIFMSALLSKRIPVVIGPAAGKFLRLAGKYLFGGRYLWKPVSPFIMAWVDLFGKSLSTGFQPDADRLSDLILTNETDKVHMVVFDGFNRCDAASVFAPVLHPHITTCNLANFDFRGEHSSYHELSNKSWPKNFYPVFKYCCTGGMLPQRLWAEVVTVSATFTDPVSVRSKPTNLTVDYMYELRKSLAVYAEPARLLLSKFDPESVSILQSFDNRIDVFIQALLSFGESPDDIVKYVKVSRVIPYCSVAHRELNENIDDLIDNYEWDVANS